MTICAAPQCERAKVPGQGARYCETHRAEAYARRHPEPTMKRKPAVCLLDDCDKAANVPGTALGYCQMHYNRFKRTGSPHTTLMDLKRQDPICKVDGCPKPKWAQGYCAMHLMRWRTHGDAGSAERRWVTPTGDCMVAGCKRAVVNGIRQMCGPHYQRWLKYGNPTAGNAYLQPDQPCAFAGCDGKHYARGMCHRHWNKEIGAAIRDDRVKTACGFCTPEQLNARIAYFGGRCWICGGEGDTIDHVKPLAKGGSNWPSNLRLACRSCNSRKRARWLGVAQLNDLRQLVLRKAA